MLVLKSYSDKGGEMRISYRNCIMLWKGSMFPEKAFKVFVKSFQKLLRKKAKHHQHTDFYWK